jgi:hypothetical protein
LGRFYFHIFAGDRYRGEANMQRQNSLFSGIRIDKPVVRKKMFISQPPSAFY